MVPNSTCELEAWSVVHAMLGEVPVMLPDATAPIVGTGPAEVPADRSSRASRPSWAWRSCHGACQG